MRPSGLGVPDPDGHGLAGVVQVRQQLGCHGLAGAVGARLHHHGNAALAQHHQAVAVGVVQALFQPGRQLRGSGARLRFADHEQHLVRLVEAVAHGACLLGQRALRVAGRALAQQLAQKIAAQGLLGLAHGALLEHHQRRHRGGLVNRQLVQLGQRVVAFHDPDVAINFAADDDRRHHALHGPAQIGHGAQPHRMARLLQLGINAALEQPLRPVGRGAARFQHVQAGFVHRPGLGRGQDI